MAWVILTACGVETIGWWGILVLLCGYFNSITGIINNKRIQRGRKPWATFEVRSSRKNPDKQQADMTPKEEKWLAEYRRREAAKTVRMQRRALWFWGALFTAWAIFGLFAEPDKSHSQTACC